MAQSTTEHSTADQMELSSVEVLCQMDSSGDQGSVNQDQHQAEAGGGVESPRGPRVRRSSSRSASKEATEKITNILKPKSRRSKRKTKSAEAEDLMNFIEERMKERGRPSQEFGEDINQPLAEGSWSLYE